MTRPMVPPTIVRGKKAKHVVVIAAVTGTSTSRVPSMAALTLSHLEVTLGVLDDHDGVVDDNPRGD
jgi:hypothetical protein